MPEIAKDYVVDSTTAKQPKMTIADITDEQHDKALGMAFGKKVVSGYENVINALTKGYTAIGFARGRNSDVKVADLPIEEQTGGEVWQQRVLQGEGLSFASAA